jgi:hypothetical protein
VNLKFGKSRLSKRLNLPVFNDTDKGIISNKLNVHHILLYFTSHIKY